MDFWGHLSIIGSTLLVASLFGFALMPFVKWIANRTGALDYSLFYEPKQPTVPRLGGLGILVSSIFAFAILYLLFPQIRELLDANSRELLFFSVGAIVITTVGIIDDLKGVRAFWKLIAQIIVALILFTGGIRFEFIPNFLDQTQPINLGNYSLVINIVWMVMAMNSMNVIDGLNGLAGGIFCTAMLLLLSLGIVESNLVLVVLASILLGTTSTFLRHNLSNTLFLGDSGSLLLGYCLGAFVPLISSKGSSITITIIPVALLSLPIIETGITVLRRVWQGSPLSLGDNQHAHHRMMAMGMGRFGVNFFVHFLSFLCGLIAIGISFSLNKYLAMGLTVLWIVLLGFFFGVVYVIPHISKMNCLGPNRPSLFLDMDRQIYRKLWQISQATTFHEIDQHLEDICRKLYLLEIVAEFHFQGNDTKYSFSTFNEEKIPNQGQVISFSIDCNQPGGIVGTIKAKGATERYSRHWTRLINWLNGLGQALSIPVSNFARSGEPANMVIQLNRKQIPYL